MSLHHFRLLPRSQVVRHQTLTLTRVSSNLTEAAKLNLYDLLAQSVEHLTFNQRVWSSNLQRDTILEYYEDNLVFLLYLCKKYLHFE